MSGINPTKVTEGLGEGLLTVKVATTVVPLTSSTSTTYIAFIPNCWVKLTVNPSDVTAEIATFPGQGT